jgi:hypothetical protein
MGGPRAALIGVPITDPTAPYHSLVYLASHGRERGFDRISVHDTNIESLWYLAEPARMRARLDSWRERLTLMNRRPTLPGSLQTEYLTLVRAVALEPDAAHVAIQTLRDGERFYDYPQYSRAVRALLRWLDALSLDAFPGQFGQGFNLVCTPANFSSIDELSDPAVLEQIVGPHAPYFREEFLPRLSCERPELVGINVTYTSQLPYALWLAREVRARMPQAYVVCGGTEISDTFKYANDRSRLGELFAGVDACVVGEGERAFGEMLQALAAGRRPARISNAIEFGGGAAVSPAIAYENIDAHVTPDYGTLDAGRYFAPASFVYYSPTRGCYWNRCTFCDYGLNFGTPTSPWRQRPLEKTIADLREISQEHRFVYFSVDVLAPAYVVKLASAIVDEGIEIVWGAEIRLEHRFDAQTCAMMRRSGCVAVSVGFESGSQRILDAIDKGTRIDRVAETMRAFAGAGIAVQIMGFTGFPTETTAEALESIEFLERNAASHTVAGLGEFQLTPGAIAAVQPERFGIAERGPFTNADISRILHFREAQPPDPDKAATVRAAKRRLKGAEFDRPFAGGIDTPHSLMYYARYGLAFPGVARGTPLPLDEPLRPNGAIVDAVAFEPLLCFDAEQYDAFRIRVARAEGTLLNAAATAARLDREIPALDSFEQLRSYFVRADGFAVALTPELGSALEALGDGRTLAELERESAASLEHRIALASIAALGLAVSDESRAVAVV